MVAQKVETDGLSVIPLVVGRVVLTMFRRRSSVRVAAALQLATIASALAQDVVRGEELARSLCAKCHFAVGNGEMTGRSGVPTFAAIAKREGQTFEGVVRWLRSSPTIMPNHHLTQNEILDLATYVMSVRGKP